MRLLLLCIAFLCLGSSLSICAARNHEDGWSPFVDAPHQQLHKLMLENNLVPDRAAIASLVRKQAQDSRSVRAAVSSENPLRLAFVLNSALNDLGWAFNHNTGRIEVEKEFGDLVITKVFEGIGDDEKHANEFFFNVLNISNFDFIIGCTYAYQFPMFTLAQEHPDKSFLAVSGYLTGLPNFGTLGSSQLYQPRYLSGLVAGSLTKKNKVGHIATFPIWDIYLQANALFIGMRQVNPDATLTITMLESWFNEDLEAYQTNILFDKHGVDVMSQASNSNPPQFITSNRGGISIGMNTDASEFVSQSVAVSVRNIWGTIYKEATYLVMANNFSAYQDLWLPISSGAVDISEFSVRVDQTLADMVLAERQNVINGKRIFCGQWAAPFVNWTGTVPDDYCLPDSALLTMDKFFDEIIFVGHPTIPTIYLPLSEGLRIAMQVLAALGLAVLFAYIVLILVYRETNMIKFGSPLFCAVSMVGAMLMVAVVFLISPSPPTAGVCNASVWLLCIGFGTFFAPIIVKTARNFLLFRSVEKFRVSILPLSNLLVAIGVILLFEFTFLILFSAIDAPSTNVIVSATDKYAYYVYCNYSGANVVLIYVLVAFNSLLILICIVATFLTRRISTHAFNETSHLTIVIYIAAFIFVILMPLYVIVNSDTAQYLIACLGLIIGNVVASSAYLLPKFYIIWRGKDYKQDPLKFSTARTSSDP